MSDGTSTLGVERGSPELRCPFICMTKKSSNLLLICAISLPNKNCAFMNMMWNSVMCFDLIIIPHCVLFIILWTLRSHSDIVHVDIMNYSFSPNSIGSLFILYMTSSIGKSLSISESKAKIVDGSKNYVCLVRLIWFVCLRMSAYWIVGNCKWSSVSGPQMSVGEPCPEWHRVCWSCKAHCLICDLHWYFITSFVVIYGNCRDLNWQIVDPIAFF